MLPAALQPGGLGDKSAPGLAPGKLFSVAQPCRKLTINQEYGYVLPFSFPIEAAEKAQFDLYVLIIGKVGDCVIDSDIAKNTLSIDLREMWVYNIKTGQIVHKKKYIE